MTKSLKTKYFAAAITLIAVSAFGTGTAFAESGETVYPEIFTESVYENAGAIKDYAVGADAVALADGNLVYIISGDRKTTYTFNSNIGALDCTQSDNGTVFYCRVEGTTYSLTYPEKSTTKTEHEFKVTKFVSTEKYDYRVYDDIIYSIVYPGPITQELEGCSNLKEYGGQAYVVKDNKINSLSDGVTSVLKLDYTNFNSAENILIGGTADKLKTYKAAEFVMFKTGAYKTEINSGDLGGRYFKLITSDTEHPEYATKRADEGETALLLCTTGNAAIVCNGSKFYITLAASIEPVTRTTELAPEFASATVCTPYDYLYSSPALTDGTKLKRVDWGTQVEVLAKLSADYSPELECNFYKVSLTDENGATVTGYIPCSFLTEKKTDDAELKEINDPAYSDEDPTKTVLIVVLIISLILVALGYLVFTATSKKKKPKTKKQNENEVG